jgi:energy-coupling factor transport system permease protein
VSPLRSHAPRGAWAAGAYLPGRSPLHRLDPRTKVLGLIALSAITLAPGPALAAAIPPALILAAYPLAGISLSRFAAGLRGFLWLILFTAAAQSLWAPGTPLAEFGIGALRVSITREGLANGFGVLIRLVALIAGAGLLAATTSPGRIGAALESILKPLGRLGLPVGDTALVFSIGLQFMPTLSREMTDIRNAQISRGIPHLDPIPLRRLGCLWALLVPILAQALRRSRDLATAMLVRGYREGGGRTALHPLGFSGGDLAAAFVVAAAAGLSILARHGHALQ